MFNNSVLNSFIYDCTTFPFVIADALWQQTLDVVFGSRDEIISTTRRSSCQCDCSCKEST